MFRSFTPFWTTEERWMDGFWQIWCFTGFTSCETRLQKVWSNMWKMIFEIVLFCNRKCQLNAQFWLTNAKKWHISIVCCYFNLTLIIYRIQLMLAIICCVFLFSCYFNPWFEFRYVISIHDLQLKPWAYF